MGQNKFEENIKEVFEKRTIRPSNDAWDKLNARLDCEPKNNSNSLPIYWIAASVIVLITISILLFSETSRVVPQVVEINQENKVLKNNEVIESETVIVDNEVFVLETNEKEKDVVNKPNLIKNNNKELVNNAINTTIIEKKLERKKTKALTFEEQKINEVVEIIQAVQLKESITDEEIDLLLFKAQREIDSQEIFNKNTGKVDAMALLNDVESELDKSFKDKVLDILKERVIQVVENNKN